MITIASALSGPWALNLRGWAWTLLPTLAVVAAQELATPSRSPAWISASFVQVAAVAGWSIAVVALSRRLTGRVVPLASALLWIGGGVVHGLVGGGLALLDGAPAEWGYRLAFWIVASATWMPLLTYALAQWDEHRRLLGERALLDVEIDEVEDRAAEDADTRGVRLAAAVDDALMPALDEIRAQLRDNGARIDAVTARTIAARLDDLAERSTQIGPVGDLSARRPVAPRASLAVASVEFELTRPVLAGALTAALVAAPLLPESSRSGGWTHAAEMGVAILVATVVLTVGFAALRSRRLTGPQRSLFSRLAVVGAGLVGAAVPLLLGWHATQARDMPLLVLVPVLVGIAASASATAVALAATNAELRAHARADRAALDELAERIRVLDDLSSARLTTLVRGELNGRLAGCAMALAFLGNGEIDDDARGDIVRTVLAQLDAAAEELLER